MSGVNCFLYWHVIQEEAQHLLSVRHSRSNDRLDFHSHRLVVERALPNPNLNKISVVQGMVPLSPAHSHPYTIQILHVNFTSHKELWWWWLWGLPRSGHTSIKTAKFQGQMDSFHWDCRGQWIGSQRPSKSVWIFHVKFKTWRLKTNCHDSFHLNGKCVILPWQITHTIFNAICSKKIDFKYIFKRIETAVMHCVSSCSLSSECIMSSINAPVSMSAVAAPFNI